MTPADRTHATHTEATREPPAATVVLVHGAWHGAWCWAAFQAELDRRGIPSFAVDLPGHGASIESPTGLHGDATHLRGVLDRLGERGHGEVVLVGHSYGGAVITQAATGRDDTAHLVYVAAFALDAGESVMGALGSFARHPVDLADALIQSDDDGSSTLDAAGAVDALYGSVDSAVIDALLPRLCPQPTATMVEEVDGSPRDDIASTYVICTKDRAVHPAHQEVMAARCGECVSLATDHSPFLSAVGELADVVEPIARATTQRTAPSWKVTS